MLNRMCLGFELSHTDDEEVVMDVLLYLCQEGYLFGSVCLLELLLVGRIARTLLDRFQPNLVVG